MDIAADKAGMRRRALAERDPAGGSGEALRDTVLRACPPRPGAAVAGFWPMGSEVDIRPLLAALHARGHALALPETPPRGQPLVFRRWAPGEALVPGRFGTSVPAPGAPAVTPGFVLVPLLAFDRRGGRLGYGGGYYDRTLAALPRAFRLGVALASQEVPSVPLEPHDVMLHAIATERGVIRP